MKIKVSKSIGFKILFFYTMLALINVSFIIFIIFENQVDLISKSSKLETEQQFSNLISTIKTSSYEMQKGFLFTQENEQRKVNQFVKLIEPYATDFFIITDENEIIYKSNDKLTPPPSMAQDALRSITVKNFSGKEYFLRIDHNKNIMYCYIPLIDYKSGNTILLAAKDMGELDRSLQNLYKQAIFVIIVMLFFHAVFALTLFKYIIKPIKQLQEGAEKISEGNFATRIPLTGSNDEFGYLAQTFNSMADSINENMTTLTGKIETTRETIKRTDKLKIKDDVTGLFNRAYLLERVQEELNKSTINNNHIAFMLITVDDFKNIISIYGTSSINIILFETSKIIKTNCSENDIVSRYNDDSFAVLSTSCSLEYITNLSEKIRSEIKNNSVITPDGNFSITVSIGVSFNTPESLQNVKDRNQLVTSSEKALSHAREAGINSVKIIS